MQTTLCLLTTSVAVNRFSYHRFLMKKEAVIMYLILKINLENRKLNSVSKLEKKGIHVYFLRILNMISCFIQGFELVILKYNILPSFCPLNCITIPYMVLQGAIYI